MILPSKHLSHNRALINVGAEVLAQLGQPSSVSEIWDRVRRGRDINAGSVPLSFDWFVLTLSFLYSISAIVAADGLISLKAGEA